ncbi:hypothetical protein Tco_1522275 [Tanacetum coccineum]
MRCSLCSSRLDFHDHLFFKYPYSERIWDSLKIGIHRKDLPNDWSSLQERNRRQFTSEKRPVNDLLEAILETIRLRLASIKGFHSAFVDRMANE